jgi:dihydroorotase
MLIEDANVLLRRPRVVDPLTGRDEVVDIRINGGRIEKIGGGLTPQAVERTMDLEGKIVAPGFIDMHVHLREPGFEYKETIHTGCMSAAEGGFTAVCCMPNTNPPIDDESVVRMIRERAKQALNGIVNVYPIATVTVGRKGEHLSPMAELVTAGAVGFSDDGDPVHDSEVMRRALEYSTMFGKPVIQHAQDLSMTKGGVMNEGFASTELGLPGMPTIAEEAMIARDIAITGYTGGQYHVAHVSSAGSIDLVRGAKARGLRVTCEVTPHHFTLSEEAVRSFDTNTKMNPPLRDPRDVEGIRKGLQDGTIDVIASDHAPHSFDEKQVEFQHAPFGIVGLETSVGLAFTELVQKGLISLEQLIRLFSVHPRRILHFPEIRIAEGEMANLTILDPGKEWIVDPASFRSLSKNSPFGGFRLRGKAIGIINNGLSYWTS